MGKNKWMKKAGVYKILKEKGREDLAKSIEESVHRLHRHAFWSLENGGEMQASKAYATILRELPDEFLKDGVYLMVGYVSTRREKEGKEASYDIGNDAEDFAESFSLFKEVKEENREITMKAINEDCIRYVGNKSDIMKDIIDSYVTLGKTFPADVLPEKIERLRKVVGVSKGIEKQTAMEMSAKYLTREE